MPLMSIIVLVIASLLFNSTAAGIGPLDITLTPAYYAYLPLIAQQAMPTPTPTATPTATPVTVPLAYFKVGTGYADVIPHQIVRTSSDRVYMFGAKAVNSTAIDVYWTTQPGVPGSSANFNGSLVYTASADPISVDAVYDGDSIVHVLANLYHGSIYDYPFDLTTNTFKTPHFIAPANPSPPSAYYPGSSGVSGMVGLDGVLNVAYWSA